MINIHGILDILIGKKFLSQPQKALKVQSFRISYETINSSIRTQAILVLIINKSMRHAKSYQKIWDL